MPGQDSPSALLQTARALCDAGEWQTTFWSTRAVAFLTRQAMETWLGQYWDATAPTVAALRSRRAQFLLLHDRLAHEDVVLGHATWEHLSSACHYKLFELEPSREQALRWIAQAERFGAALERAHGAP